MSAWRKVDETVYRSLGLRAHELLADVPVHDAWQVVLPGGGRGRTLADAREAMTGEQLGEINPAVRALFGLRRWLGDVFDLDGETASPEDASYVHRLTAEDRERSLVEPGSADGPFRVLYVFPEEAVSEARNKTVHAFLVYTLKGVGDDYRLTWGIHVAPVSALTPLYMALIAPFRRFVVYPAILKHVRRRWIERFGG